MSPVKLKNEEGEEFDVLTNEEIETQKNEAIELAKQDYEAEKETLNRELAEAKEALAKTGDKDYNFSQLRKTVDGLKASKETLEKTFTSELSNLKKSLSEKTINGFIKEESGGDADLEKKLRFHYDKTLASMPAETEEDIRTRVKSASLLEGRTNTNSSFISSAGSGNVKIKTEKLTQDQQDLANKMGVSQEDIKKYSKQ